MILAAGALTAGVLICSSQKEDAEEMYRKAVARDYRVYSPVIPDTLTFAGEAVPLNTYYVREGLDNELIVNMYRQSSTVLYFKRANRYFPVIEPILKRNGIPLDFKYLCVIESGLTNATSPAKAQGFWQFIPSTGSKYGLEINDEVDMRDDLVSSTEAACKYLRSLYTRTGSWTAAAAAYNCGENGLGRRMDKQQTKNYYDLWLNSCDLYPPVPTRAVVLSGQNVDIYQFARNHGTTYKVLRLLNPWLKTDQLKNKNNRSYMVQLPSEGIQYSKLAKGKRNTEMISHI